MMLLYVFKTLSALEKRWRSAIGLKLFQRQVIDIRPAQRRYFLDVGVDGRKRVNWRPRRLREGYYGEVAPKSPATAVAPYMYWSSRTMRHTTHERGRVRSRRNRYSITNRIRTLDRGKSRPFANVWWRPDLIAPVVVPQLGGYYGDTVFRGRPLARRSSRRSRR